MNLPGDRPRGADDFNMPLNPCVPCWRHKHLLIPSAYVADNGVRRIVLCTKHYHEFKEMDQDYRGQIHTTYRAILPGEHVPVDGGHVD